jgi:stage V sporulation protein G
MYYNKISHKIDKFKKGRYKDLNITDTRIRLIKKEDSKLKAVASITIDNCLVVHDIKVVQGPEKLFISMPSRKTSEGEFKDIVHAINNETREQICSAIFAAYERADKENN